MTHLASWNLSAPSYLVLTAGFYFAPHTVEEDLSANYFSDARSLSWPQYIKALILTVWTKWFSQICDVRIYSSSLSPMCWYLQFCDILRIPKFLAPNNNTLGAVSIMTSRNIADRLRTIFSEWLGMRTEIPTPRSRKWVNDRSVLATKEGIF